MTTRAKQSVLCGNCDVSAEHTVLMSTNSFGSADLDLRPPEGRRSTMDTWLQLCSHCGYCGPDISQSPADAEVLRSKPYRTALRRKNYPKLARRFLAYAVASESSDPVVIAQAYLQAAWICDDERRVEEAAEARQCSAEWFRRRKPFEDDEGALTAGAIFVDVLRRSGQFAEASSECAELLTASGAVGVLRKVLEYEQRLIAQSNIGAQEVESAFP